jgi:hypothetical protein
VVTGDDLLGRIDELIASGHPLANMDTAAPLSAVRNDVIAANAYLGSSAIVEALAQGANIVVTGRSTDTALTMAPLRHEFGWAADAWNRLAAGIIAGHIIECGAQCSGGNCLYDWQNIPDLANVGYPIVEATEDGSFVVTKHPSTGGRVNIQSVTEQLVYEMGDPRNYITPDVIADFTSVELHHEGENRVRVSGVRGSPPTASLKVSIAYRAGFKAVGTLTYGWPDAARKAASADEILRRRLEQLGLNFEKILTEFVGLSATHGPLAPQATRDFPPELQLRVGVRSSRREDVERFTRELAPLILNGPPSVTGFAGGRPKVEEIVAYWPALIDKGQVSPMVEMVQ